MSGRHFDLNQNSGRGNGWNSSNLSNDPRQMAFSDLEFQLPQAEFIEPKASTAYDFSTWILHRKLSYEKVSKKSFVASVVIHSLLAMAVIFLNIPQPDKPRVETITIEIQDVSKPLAASPAPAIPQAAKAVKAAAPIPVIAQSPSAKAVAPAPQAKASQTDEITEPVIKLKPIVAAKPVPAPKAATSPKASANAKMKSASQAAPAKSISPIQAQSFAKESPVVIPAVPETLDDIQSPPLDESASSAVDPKMAAAALDQDVENDFKKVDHDSEALVEKESRQLGAMTENLEKETQDNLDSAEAAAKAEALALQKANAQRRQQEAQAIAAAKAAEDEASARAEAAADARAAQEGAATALAANNAGSGSAAGSSGPAASGEVRSLQDLKQKPGNPKPSYDNVERLRGDNGEVVFWAYITKDGSTSQFKIVKSTGHRNLDFKTLKALKKWKFYPGQEGWVEMPFKWDLQGGPREMPTLLRRSK